ncbi:MAG: hypothetical protein AAF968_02660 [Pseudomonadota bacterium]
MALRKRGTTTTKEATRTRMVTVRAKGGKRRVCLPDMPEGQAPAEPAASFVLGLHGGNGDAETFARRSGMMSGLHAYGHDIAFPQARRHWADGRPPLERGWAADLDLIETLREQHHKALDREVPLALVGSSNGGMFSLRLACELSPAPAIAVAVVAAMPEALAERLEGEERPVPVMLVQGTEDVMIPWHGGEVPSMGGFAAGGRLLSADDTAAFWRARNRTQETPRVKQGRIAGLPVRIEYWPAGDGGADLWRVVVKGGTHRILDNAPRRLRAGTLEDLISRTVVWYTDPERLSAMGTGGP